MTLRQSYYTPPSNQNSKKTPQLNADDYFGLRSLIKDIRHVHVPNDERPIQEALDYFTKGKSYKRHSIKNQMYQRAKVHKDNAYRNFVSKNKGDLLAEARTASVENTMQVTYLEDPFSLEEEGHDIHFIATYNRHEDERKNRNERLKNLLLEARNIESPVTKLLMSSIGTPDYRPISGLSPCLENQSSQSTADRLPKINGVPLQLKKDSKPLSQKQILPKWIETWNEVDQNFEIMKRHLKRDVDSIKELDDDEKELLLVPLTMKDIEKSYPCVIGRPKKLVNWHYQ